MTGLIQRLTSGLRRALRDGVSFFLVAVLTVYAKLLSPLLHALTGARCRFHPTCSMYAREAIERHGPVSGTWLAFRRLGRCHPFHPGGLDPVPESESSHG